MILLGRFWSLLDRFGVPQRFEFCDFLKVLRSSRPVRSKKRRPTKKQRKQTVFIGFSHVRYCAHASKIDKDSFRTGVSSESRNRSLSERSFFEFVSVKTRHESSLERLERRLGTLLDALGALWGPSWALLGRSWALLGRSWGALGSLFFASASENSSREAPKSDFGRFWLDFSRFS